MNEQNVHGCNIWEIYVLHKATQHTGLHLSAHFALSEFINPRDSAQKNRMPCLTTCSLPPFTLAQFQVTTLVHNKIETKLLWWQPMTKNYFWFYSYCAVYTTMNG